MELNTKQALTEFLSESEESDIIKKIEWLGLIK